MHVEIEFEILDEPEVSGNGEDGVYEKKLVSVK